MYICVPHMCLAPRQLEVELWMVVSYHVDDGTQI